MQCFMCEDLCHEQRAEAEKYEPIDDYCLYNKRDLIGDKKFCLFKISGAHLNIYLITALYMVVIYIQCK
jgi:hypothetical protein